MNKQFYLFILGIFYINVGIAQTNYGARLTGMGNNGAAVKDIWGVTTNPSSIAEIALPTIQLTHQEHFFAKAIRNQAIAFVLPINRFVFGLSVQRYGITEYHSLKSGIVLTRQFGPKLAIGLRANYHQFKIDNYGATTGVSLDLEAIYQLSNELCFGFYINNPSKAGYRTHVIHTLIPVTAYIGIAYRTSTKFLIASTISKEDVAVGTDYQIIKQLNIRSGISLKPFTHYFGIGFSKPKFSVDFTITKHPNFDHSPQLTIGYVF